MKILKSYCLAIILIILAFETTVDAAPDAEADALDTLNLNVNLEGGKSPEAGDRQKEGPLIQAGNAHMGMEDHSSESNPVDPDSCPKYPPFMRCYPEFQPPPSYPVNPDSCPEEAPDTDPTANVPCDTPGLECVYNGYQVCCGELYPQIHFSCTGGPSGNSSNSWIGNNLLPPTPCGLSYPCHIVKMFRDTCVEVGGAEPGLDTGCPEEIPELNTTCNVHHPRIGSHLPECVYNGPQECCGELFPQVHRFCNGRPIDNFNSNTWTGNTVLVPTPCDYGFPCLNVNGLRKITCDAVCQITDPNCQPRMGSVTKLSHSQG